MLMTCGLRLERSHCRISHTSPRAAFFFYFSFLSLAQNKYCCFDIDNFNLGCPYKSPILFCLAKMTIGFPLTKKLGKWGDQAWRDVCIHNTSASFLSGGIVWCCGSSFVYCLVSSAGGLSCKQLSEGNLLHFPFQKHSFSVSTSVSLSLF